MGRAWVPETKEAQPQPSAGKVMTTVFWDVKGVVMLEFFTQEKYNKLSALCNFAR